MDKKDRTPANNMRCRCSRGWCFKTVGANKMLTACPIIPGSLHRVRCHGQFPIHKLAVRILFKTLAPPGSKYF
jgi:hypothetical protein